MALPLAAAGLAALAYSGGANLYAQANSRALYRRQINAYKTLQSGYARYLAKHGRELNPARAYERWGSRIDSLDTNIRNSYAGSFGTAAGTFGAGAMMTSRWL